MKRLTILVSASAAVLVFLSMGMTAAMAAAPSGTLGADVSWPQCGGSLPGSGGTAPALFGIVGVNNGKPGAANPCLATEFGWANTLTARAQAPLLYVNTADPGNTVADWPTANLPGPTDPYGSCTTVKSRGRIVGANTQACAFEYGVVQATKDLNFAASAGASTATWWLDVETANSWLSRSLINLNQAELLGMVDVFQNAGFAVGAYSTHYQWNKILGPLESTAGPTLNSLSQWIPTGGSSDQIARADCTDPNALPNFTGGTRTYVQYTTTYDYDIAC
jgi:hypothetical protein